MSSDPTKKDSDLRNEAGELEAKAVNKGDAAKDAKDAKDARESDEERWNRTKSNFKTIVGAVALAFFIRIVLFEAFEIDGPSMEPTLLNGDRVVVAKFPFGLFLPFTDDAVVS